MKLSLKLETALVKSLTIFMWHMFFDSCKIESCGKLHFVQGRVPHGTVVLFFFKINVLRWLTHQRKFAMLKDEISPFFSSAIEFTRRRWC